MHEAYRAIAKPQAAPYTHTYHAAEGVTHGPRTTRRSSVRPRRRFVRPHAEYGRRSVLQEEGQGSAAAGRGQGAGRDRPHDHEGCQGIQSRVALLGAEGRARLVGEHVRRSEGAAHRLGSVRLALPRHAERHQRGEGNRRREDRSEDRHGARAALGVRITLRRGQRPRYGLVPRDRFEERRQPRHRRTLATV